MGLFDFLKKKEQEPLKNEPFTLEKLNTDFPAVDGQNLSTDLSLPSLDGPLLAPDDALKDTSYNNFNNNPANLSLPNTPSNMSVPEMNLQEDVSKDLNQLFMSDPSWKEPDWSTYVPYSEQKIEPPQVQDFNISPPQPIAPLNDLAPQAKQYEIPEFEDTERRVPDDIPYDVFVKGDDYKKVFDEMSEIKKALAEQDTKMLGVFETFKKEELAINMCKDNMESLYKRMLIIDKKVFT